MPNPVPQPPAPDPQGLPGDEVPIGSQGNRPRPKKKVKPKPIPQGFLNQLDEVGLVWDPKTKSIQTKKPGLASKEQKILMEKAFVRFGIADNGAFDPTLVYVDKDGVSWDLGTGLGGTGGTSVASDEELEHYRTLTGFDEQNAFAHFVEASTFDVGGEPYVPYAAQSLENFQRYQAGARANYIKKFADAPMNFNNQEDQPQPGPSFIGGFDFEAIPTDQLSGAHTALGQMLGARQARESAQSYYGDIFSQAELAGFEEGGE